MARKTPMSRPRSPKQQSHQHIVPVDKSDTHNVVSVEPFVDFDTTSPTTTYSNATSSTTTLPAKMFPVADETTAASATNASLSFLSRLPRRCLPMQDASQWGVACCAVILPPPNESASQATVVAAGGGSKCLAAQVVAANGDAVVRDSHAEILCRRSLVRAILLHIAAELRTTHGFDPAPSPPSSDSSATSATSTATAAAASSDASTAIEAAKPCEALRNLIVITVNRESRSVSVSFRHDTQLVFYLTQAPCGAASMTALDAAQTPEQRVINELNRSRALSQDDDKDRDTSATLRGRIDYANTHALRTKPGRPDAPATRSMSCSDKMLRWNVLGILGRWVAPLAIDPLRITAIVVDDYFDSTALHNALVSRAITSPLPVHEPALLRAVIPNNSQTPDHIRDDNRGVDDQPLPPRKRAKRNKDFAFPTLSHVTSLLGDSGKRPVPVPVAFTWDSMRGDASISAETLVDGRRQGSGRDRKTGEWNPASRSVICGEHLASLQHELLSLIAANGFHAACVSRNDDDNDDDDNDADGLISIATVMDADDGCDATIATRCGVTTRSYEQKRNAIHSTILNGWVGYR